MNWIQIAYPRGRREYIDIYGDFETMTVQDVLDKINNRSLDKISLFEKYFTFRNHHRFLDSDKCKQFLELYGNKNDAIESENPLPRTMLIRDIPGINPRNTKEYIWFYLDRNRCLSYLTNLQMAQKRRSLAVSSMLPQNVQENIMSQLDVDTVGEIGSRMRPSGKITQKLGLGRVPVELDDYDMDQNYDEFVEQRRRIEQLRKQREELQRERDEDFENFRENDRIAGYLEDLNLEQYGGGLEDDEILNKLNDINVKLDLCCGNYDKATKDIQRVYRGHTSRRDTRRTMRPNITESLLNMPKDVGDRINELIPAAAAIRRPVAGTELKLEIIHGGKFMAAVDNEVSMRFMNLTPEVLDLQFYHYGNLSKRMKVPPGGNDSVFQTHISTRWRVEARGGARQLEFVINREDIGRRSNTTYQITLGARPVATTRPQKGGNSYRNKYERCKKMSESQQRAIDRITRLYEDKLFEDMDRMDEQESMENNAMADYINSINQSGGMFDDLAIELIDEQLEKLNCRDRLSYCQTNRKSRGHCNSKRTFKKYIEPCRKKSKMNKTKRRAIEVSKRLQKKNLLESQLKSKQRDIQLREERREREFFERLRQPRDIAIRRNIDEDFEFDDDDLNGFPTTTPASSSDPTPASSSTTTPTSSSDPTPASSSTTT